jgi:hypothetical protein
MKPDPFEQHLRQQPWRPVPPGWRDAIVTHSTFDQQRTVAARPPSSWINRVFREWLWPHPVAWAALAACWTAILTLHSIAAPSATELAQAREGARIAQVVLAASGSPQTAALTSNSFPPAADQPRRGRADQGRHATHPTLILA